MHMKGYKKPGELCVAPLLYQYIIVVIGEVAKDKHGTQLLPVILKKKPAIRDYGLDKKWGAGFRFFLD